MDFIKSTCYIFLLFISPQILTKTIKSTESRCAPNVPHRCFPDELCWPSEEEWKSLNESVHGRLSIPHLSIEACLGNDATFINGEDSCQRSLERLGEDPFYFQQFPGGVESTGKNLNMNWFVNVEDYLQCCRTSWWLDCFTKLSCC